LFAWSCASAALRWIISDLLTLVIQFFRVLHRCLPGRLRTATSGPRYGGALPWSLHRSAPPCLGPLVPVRSLPGRRSLRSTGTPCSCRSFKTWLFEKPFRTSLSDTNCMVTFSLGLSVTTLRRFCRLRSTRWHNEWYNMTWCGLSVFGATQMAQRKRRNGENNRTLTLRA